MRWREWCWLGCLIGVGIGLAGCGPTPPPAPLARRGVIDLSRTAFTDQQTLDLTGEWRVIQHRLVPPGQPLPAQFGRVPGPWQSSAPALTTPLDTGRITYGLTVRLPARFRRQPTSLALHLPPIHSAYRLFLNGHPLAESGRVGPASVEQPNAASRVVYLPLQRDSLVLRLWVSNVHFNEGGIRAVVSLGSVGAIARKQTTDGLFLAGMIGGLLLIGLYHLSLFRLRRREPGALYFGLTCLLLTWRLLFAGDPLFFWFWPDADYAWSLRSLFLVFPLGITAWSLFLDSVFPVFRSRWFKRIFLGFEGAYVGLILLTDVTIYGRLLLLQGIVVLLMAVYFVAIQVRALWQGNRVALVMLLGTGVLLASFVHDLYWEAIGVRVGYMLPVGMMGFALFQSLVLAIRFAIAHRETERLATELSQALDDYRTADHQRREAEQRRAIEELKTLFFTNITHEIRTPLSLIIAPIERLLQQPLPDAVRQTVWVVNRNARQLLTLINQLLDLSRIDAQQLPPSDTPGDLAGFISDRLEAFAWQATDKAIGLHYDPPGYLPLFRFDTDKWDKILTNLLSNAFKFTPAGGTIRVGLLGTPDATGHWLVTLTVSDTGPGIAPHHLPRIFERFYQADASTRRAYAGTGIGLALVQELTGLMGGQVTVESELGAGTTFTLLVPLQAVIGVMTSTEPLLPVSLRLPPPAPPQPGRPTVLVIEDQTDLREFLADSLGETYHVLTAADGEEGWNLCLDELPDLVVSDVMMPRVDGLALSQRIRDTHTTSHIAVLLLTARSSPDRRIEGLKTGANDYLGKPFHFDELRLRVSNLLQYQQTLRDYHHRHLTQPLARPTPPPNSDHPFVQQLQAVITAQLDNTSLSVEVLADAVAMSSRTLNRKLAAIAGLTAVELVRTVRLREAAQLLATGTPVSETAYRVGFESPSYFGQCFKDYFAVTPSEYAKS